ncbi:MAG: cbb3-type cytochrome oxidase assembly protein CcoS [Pigmentiphaga sp.]|nr:cbb3-type cytochrome oxidase assembly protein CcoS [Pigmentiphaga sp.]
MESLYILLPLSLVLVVLIIGVLWWSISSGQYDSLDRASVEILMDQDSDPEQAPEAAPDKRLREEGAASSADDQARSARPD